MSISSLLPYFFPPIFILLSTFCFILFITILYLNILFQCTASVLLIYMLSCSKMCMSYKRGFFFSTWKKHFVLKLLLYEQQCSIYLWRIIVKLWTLLSQMCLTPPWSEISPSGTPTSYSQWSTECTMEAPSWSRPWPVPWRMRATNLIPQTGNGLTITMSFDPCSSWFI